MKRRNTRRFNTAGSVPLLFLYINSCFNGAAESFSARAPSSLQSKDYTEWIRSSAGGEAIRQTVNVPKYNGNQPEDMLHEKPVFTDQPIPELGTFFPYPKKI